MSLLIEMCQDCSTMDLKIDYIGNLSCAVMCLIKIVMLRIHHNKMYLIISSAISDWVSNKNENSYKIMRSHAHTGRSVYIGQMSFAFVATITLIIANLPLLLADQSKFENVSLPQNPLPLPMNCFYKNMSLTTYKWVYALQSVQLIYTAIGNCGTDVFFFGLAMHACGQFEILRNDLTEFGVIGEGVQLRESLHILIKRHKHLIYLSQQLEDSFNGILFVQLFFNTLIIVALGFYH